MKIKENGRILEVVTKYDRPRPKYKDENRIVKNNNNYLLLAFLTLASVFSLYIAGSLIVINKLHSRESAYIKMLDGYTRENEYLKSVAFKLPETPEEVIYSVFGEQSSQALEIAKCESSLNPKITNKSSSATGLFQVLAQTHNIDKKWLKHPLINALVAKELYKLSGWNPWLASNHCHKLISQGK